MLPSRILRSTVNAAEIAHFSRLSSQWWDETGEFAFLHQMNPVRMHLYARNSVTRTKLHSSLARLGARTLGSYIREALLENKKRYDVSARWSLEHVDNPALFLQTCSDLLKPSGHLFLSTISRTPLSYFLTIFMAENVMRKVASGTHTYDKFINPDELVEFFNERKWITTAQPTRTEAEVRGIIYNPLLSKWVLAPREAFGSTACNYMFWVRKPE
ncbi:hypothetical protein CPB85DRAFT_1550325 [Mucidula mucida]|nr:hypothetical protein CPB85DRAFT_1550325 [Mucidula mucida]